MMTRRTLSLLAALTLAASVPGCASAGGGGASARSVRDAPITAAELSEGAYANIAQAVRRLRPTWLTRLAGVYIAGFQVSQRDWESEPIAAVGEIRIITCDVAVGRYGSRCLNGRFLEIERRR
jgi:hypothetical protein